VTSSTPAMYLVEITTPSSSLVTSPVPALHLLLFHLNTTPAY